MQENKKKKIISLTNINKLKKVKMAIINFKR